MTATAAALMVPPEAVVAVVLKKWCYANVDFSIERQKNAINKAEMNLWNGVYFWAILGCALFPKKNRTEFFPLFCIQNPETKNNIVLNDSLILLH